MPCRMCVGYKLAQLEVRMAVARLMQRFAVSIAPGAQALDLHTTFVFKPSRVDIVFAERGQPAQP
jgi:cytochrome P450